MGLFKKRNDPIAERERALDARIASLEGQIKQLNQRIVEDQSQPRLRSTAKPHAQPVPDPAFEDLRRHPIQRPEPPNTADHYNDLGVRKYDLAATLRRWWHELRGNSVPNPKLVNYLAAGSIHGLRPLRYEKRIARNRFLAVFLFLVVVIWGALYFYLRNR